MNTIANPQTPCTPAVIAFELLTLPSPTSKQGLSVRALMDAAAARLMVAGMTGASTGLKFTNGEIAQWMATILSSQYQGSGHDLDWADSSIIADTPTFGSAYALRASLDSVEATASALREAATTLIHRTGKFCLIEYGYCDVKGKAPSLSDWTELHADKVIGRVAHSESMSTAFMIFTDQRAALKSAKAEAQGLGQSNTAQTSASIIAAAVALDSIGDDE